jgi:hypothetical protein
MTTMMQIHNFLRAQRMKSGFMSYEDVVDKAASHGFITCAVTLSDREKKPMWLQTKTRAMYTETYELSEAQRDMLDVLSANCLVRKGRNTNPFMQVIDTRVFEKNAEAASALVIKFLKSPAFKEWMWEDDPLAEQTLKGTIKGLLCTSLNPKMDDS